MGFSKQEFSRQMEWLAISFSRGPSRSTVQTIISCSSCIGRCFFFFLTTEPPGKPLAMFYLFKKRSNSNSSKFLHHKIIKGDFTFTCFLQAPLGPKCTSDAYQYVCREGSLPFCLSVRRRAARRPATSWPSSLPRHTCPGQRLASRACHRHPAHSALTSPLCASFPTGSWQHYRKGNY